MYIGQKNLRDPKQIKKLSDYVGEEWQLIPFFNFLYSFSL